MKKRAQQPDSYTFTILLRGFSWYPQYSHTNSRALSIYMSMFAENSPVKPSIIHTNAILKVCAQAHDVDAMLGIAADLPTRGSGAPNNLTFTIILNAIRSKAFRAVLGCGATSKGEDTGKNIITERAIRQGRRMWVEIRQRWMSGDLRLDEEFVCAMGRLLLLGHEAHDHDDVLSLLEQTMGIPRQVARIADLGRAQEAPGSDDGLELPSYAAANVELETLLPPSPTEEDDFSGPRSDPFAPLAKAAGPTQSAVRPGRNTLSLVLDACILLKYARAAQNYWGLLTSPDGHYKIVPDSENYHMYLRLLRLQRSAKLAVELIDELRSGDLTDNAGVLQTKTFRIALSCCVRDSKNRNSIHYAGKLVRIMTDTLPYPDAKALSMYLQVALRQEPRDWRVIMGAIRGSELGLRNLRSLLAYDPAGPQKQNEEDVLELVKGLISAFDVVLDLGNEDIHGEEKKRCREQRNTLTAYITRTHNRHVAEAEGKRRLLGDQGAGRTGESRSGNRSGEERKADGDGENDVFEGERDEAVARKPAEEVRPEWKMGRRAQKWEMRGRQTGHRTRVYKGAGVELPRRTE